MHCNQHVDKLVLWSGMALGETPPMFALKLVKSQVSVPVSVIIGQNCIELGTILEMNFLIVKSP